ncbi:hypothetical protein A2625_00800 [candidate division WOR-1 bacterium RIFCSPHIGHO2_01_FULL_53_15]|uniref:histidine kinase n=1 Tax=candidate division WOR-1 bacterium RIFCSPHIGHO2_01_FULL_53_15 TaxID=1802564 RepID=A0A1F4Q5F9_UNCSA|nr:MAG: hypothetical protein A2625_00800 [candidate division WOR-1 bacterium RIFCSPHIGHO2_01_FULL_53_15]
MSILILAMDYVRGYGIFLTSKRNLATVSDLQVAYAASEHLRALIVFDLIMPANDYISTADPGYKTEFEKALVKTNRAADQLLGNKIITDLESGLGRELQTGLRQIIVGKSRRIFALTKPVGNPLGMKLMREIDAQAHRLNEWMEEKIDAPLKARLGRVRQDFENFGRLVNLIFLFSTAVSFLLSYLFAVWAAGRISGPIGKLEAAAQKMRDGDLAARADIRTGDEIENLGQAFNAMAQNVKASFDDLKNREADLRQAGAALERANRVKTEFLSMFSREMQSPLAVVKQHITALAEGAPAADHLPNIKKLCGHVAEMISGIFDVLRLERGQGLTLNKELLNMNNVISKVAGDLEEEAAVREVKLKLDRPETPLPLEGDEAKLERALTNLIGNAVKFAPAGGWILVRAQQEDSRLRVEVSDNGIGIAAADLEKVFEKFYQADNPYVKNAGGLGLGLTIAREIIEAHGGKIWAESAGLGRGAKLTFTLPIM